MSKEGSKRRGIPFPSGQTHIEAEKLGPYPSWGGWKSTIGTRLGINLSSELNNGSEEIVKKIYDTRRLVQLGADPKLYDELITEIDEKHPDFLDSETIVRIVRLIVAKTVSLKVEEKTEGFRPSGRRR